MSRVFRYQTPETQSATEPTVYVKTAWADPWVAVKFLRALSVTESTGSGLSNAVLSWEYGYLLHNPADALVEADQVYPLAALYKFVKIEWTPHSGTENYDESVATAALLTTLSNPKPNGYRVRVVDTGRVWQLSGTNPATGSWSDTGPALRNLKSWVGVVTEQNLRSLTRELANDSDGTQVLRAVGLEWFLHRKQVNESWVEDVAHVSTRRVGEGLAFNANRDTRATSDGALGNQANITDANGVPIFAKELGTARAWNAADIVRYLLAYHSEIVTGLTWELPTESRQLIEWHEPTRMETHGRTLWELIDECVPRRRGLLWWTELDEPNDKVVIRVDSMLVEDLELPSTRVIKAARDQVEIEANNQPGVLSLELGTSAQRAYEAVCVEGARRGAVVTLSIPTDLEKQWTTANETSYGQGATLTSGFSALRHVSDKKRLNDSHRMNDPILSRVFTSFKLKEQDTYSTSGERWLEELDWNGDDLVVPESVEVWYQGTRIEAYLPLKENVDYADPESPTTILAATSASKYRKPLVTIKVQDKENGAGTLTEVREDVTKLGSQRRAEGADMVGPSFNCHIDVHDDAPGLSVMPSVPAHILAKGVFVETNNDSDFKPQLDYRTIHATVYVTFAERIRVRHPEVPAARFGVPATLFVRLGDRCHLDRLIEGTELSLEAGKPVLAESSAYVRDDRRRLRDIARLAFEWYSLPRRVVKYRLATLSADVRIGSLVLRVNSHAGLNSSATSVEHDFETNSTTVQTEFVELAIGDLVGA